MKKIWEVLRGNREEKPFDAIQIEVSSLCNLRCKFCPTTYLNDSNEQKFMKLANIKKLEPYLKLAKWVYLQGWGEPLLNKEIWDITNLVKGTGAKVGFTTNGTLLTEENIAKIIHSRVDLVSTSIAGATQEVHGNLRINSQLANILESIRLLVEVKRKSEFNLPLITLSYMLTTESIYELLKAVITAYELGVDDFYTTNLDYVFSEEINNCKVFTWGEEKSGDFETEIKRAEEYALAHSFPFRTYPLKPGEEKAVCDLNPARMVFITSNGDVTPCTYLGRFINPRYYRGRLVTLKRKSFGNIYEQDFWDIWSNETYREFRRPFMERARAYQDLISSYTDFEPNLTRIKDAEKQYILALRENPLPEECMFCPKTYGI